MIRLKVSETSRGLVFVHGRARYPIDWPAGVWKKLPASFRAVLTDNLAHLLTIDLPFVRDASGVELNRRRPCFWAQYRTMVMGGVPQAVETCADRTTKTLERFRTFRYEFAGDVPRPLSSQAWPARERAVVLFSSGKDSLATLGLAREMGLDPVPVYVDDTVSPAENRLKRERVEELRAMGLPAQIVTNRVEQLDGPALRRGKECGFGRLHRMTALTLLALPVARAVEARFIALGCEQDMNFSFANKDGFLTYPSFDRTSGWVLQLDLLTRTLTGGAVRTMSLVEPLTGFAVMKVLLGRYPDLATLMVSCESLDASSKARGCGSCPKCARATLAMLALGADPASVGLPRSMMDARDGRYYAVFDGRETDTLDRSAEAKEQQELAFHLAIDLGLKGPLARRFSARCQDRLCRDDLLSKHLALFPAGTVPSDLRERLLRILREATGQMKTLF